MAEVRARAITINCRRSSYAPDKLIRSRYWPNRRPYLVKALKAAEPEIIGTQECTKQQAGDITHDLGANFSYFGGDGDGNGPVIWDGLKWDAVEWFEKEIDAPGERYMVAVKLASRLPKNPGFIWAVTCHLTVGSSSTAASYRIKQIRAVIRELQHHDGWEYSAIFGDFNSDSYSGKRGAVLTIAAELGFRGLRERIKPAVFVRDSYSSVNGWKDTPSTGRWVDNILTPAKVTPYAGSLEFTCTRVYDRCGSDHNIIRGSLKWDNGGN